MPTSRKSLTKREPLPSGVRDYLLTGDRNGDLDAFLLGDDELRKAWSDNRDGLLADHVRKSPGTRPWVWWKFSAPRAVVDSSVPAWVAERMPEPRKRLGGRGTAKHDAFGDLPSFDRGIPVWWVSAFDVEYYNGRAVDIHGEKIGEGYAEGHFPHDAIDRDDPPVFESEAAYLRRLDLLLPGEEQRLPADAFDPEVIEQEEDDE